MTMSCKKLVRAFKFGLNNLLETVLQQANATRFNSTGKMFESIINNWDEIVQILTEKRKTAKLNSIDVDYLIIVFMFLSKFKYWSDMTEGHLKPTLHLVWIAIVDIKLSLMDYEFDTDLEQQMKIVALDYVNENFALDDLHRAATFLNPQYKSLKFATDIEIRLTHDIVRYLMNEMDEEEAEPVELASTSSSSSPMFDYIDDEVKDELEEYISYKVVKTDTLNLIEWWKDRTEIFPRLSKVAFYLHSIPAGSTVSERLFSISGRIITELRSNIDPGQVQNLMLLRNPPI